MKSMCQDSNLRMDFCFFIGQLCAIIVTDYIQIMEEKYEMEFNFSAVYAG
jgi:hypothetical protein